MRSDEPDQRLVELHRAADQVSANLVELEIDTGRELLDASELTGETAARWSASNVTLTELWRRHDLLKAFLKQADGLRGSKRAERLHAMLDGASIELASTEVPLAQRTLLGSADQAQRCSPAELLEGMSEQFESRQGDSDRDQQRLGPCAPTSGPSARTAPGGAPASAGARRGRGRARIRRPATPGRRSLGDRATRYCGPAERRDRRGAPSDSGRSATSSSGPPS